MTTQMILGVIFFSVCVGMFFTRQRVLQRRKQQLALRLAPWIVKPEQSEHQPETLIKEQAAHGIFGALAPALTTRHLTLLFKQAGLHGSVSTFLGLTVFLLFVPPALATYFEFDLLISLAIGLLLSCLPWMVLIARRSMFRRKFTQQLPDAIDLMVSVLRSGHSIPQAVKTISQEIADPCGAEFKEVLQRMNLGQPLSHAITYSCEKLESDELDLIRRAIAIQSEVGGSLAELLDKTNSTLRQRLKLVQRVGILTAQSKLTAIIVGLLPVVLAIALQFISPGYLDPLVTSSIGKTLLAVAVVLELIGLMILKKMATVKV